MSAVVERLQSRLGRRPDRTGGEVRGRLAGDARAGSLLPVQVLHSMGETMFAVSLAGSLFFNVSVDAARPRILLYLALTMAPFAVLGPLIGPVIDRVGGGHRTMLAIALGGRALTALVLATQLRSLLFYPLAFVIIVLAKVFAVSRNALVPVLVDDRDHLVVVNSRLARTASIAGGAAAPVALLLLTQASARWVLVAGGLLYGLGALSVVRIPSLGLSPKLDGVRVVADTEMSGSGIRSATIVMAGMRAAVGFALFHLGFALKQAGQPAWVFGVLATVSAGGTFLGTFVAPRLRRRWPEQRLLTVSLVLPMAVGVVTALRFHPVTVALAAFALGLGASVARRAFDGVVQAEAPHAKRGQAFAGLETRLELAWVLGALAAVATRAPGWVGMAGLTALIALLVLDRVRRHRDQAVVGSVEAQATLPLRLLETAEAVAARGDLQQALVVAVAAVESACTAHLPVASDDAAELRRLVARAHDDPDAAEAALHLAQELVGDAVSRVEPGRLHATP